MKKIFLLIKTCNSIGLLNIIQVFFYRILSNPFIAKVYFPKKKFSISEKFFKHTRIRINIPERQKKDLLNYSDNILNGDIYYYSYKKINIGSTPNWFLNPFNGLEMDGKNRHWSELNDFNKKLGDIKHIWEQSRFNWVGSLACAYKLTLDIKYLKKINDWFFSWSQQNPANTGPNWKCGQEASLRLINIILSYEIIGEKKLLKNLENFLIMHINRILPTIFYAKAQNNNHGISEGCALYLVGTFLGKRTEKEHFFLISKKGLRLLEDRVQKLILDDGTFSQYSIVYHRMVLDLLSITELLRDRWRLKPFSNLFYKKVALAIDWYSNMIEPITGNAPNMGSNDGTYLFNYDFKQYRDFRPTLQLSSTIFRISTDKFLLKNHILLKVFNIPTFENHSTLFKAKIFSNGGYIKLLRAGGMAILKVPVYRYRPSHADALHLDIWQDGVNYIRDTGTYSYALDNENLDFFSGTAGHSTVQFNNQNQMPRLSRFLFGNWLYPSNMSLSKNNNKMGASYRSSNNQYHSRFVKKVEKGWVIKDEIKGTFRVAVLRYILPIDTWTISLNNIYNKKIHINVTSDHSVKVRMKEGLESLYYMKKEPVKVLEIETFASCFIKTNLTFLK